MRLLLPPLFLLHFNFRCVAQQMVRIIKVVFECIIMTIDRDKLTMIFRERTIVKYAAFDISSSQFNRMNGKNSAIQTTHWSLVQL